MGPVKKSVVECDSKTREGDLLQGHPESLENLFLGPLVTWEAVVEEQRLPVAELQRER
jgi:hypothetical protein